MTSRCSEDCEGRVKINRCVTATPFPLGLSTVPPGSSAGLGSGTVQVWALGVPLVLMAFLFACFSSWLGPPSASARGFLGPFVVFLSFILVLTLFLGKVLGCASWSSAILCVEASEGGVGWDHSGWGNAGWVQGGAWYCTAAGLGCWQRAHPPGKWRRRRGSLCGALLGMCWAQSPAPRVLSILHARGHALEL